MPYPGLPKDKIPKMDSCVSDIIKSHGTSKSDAIAICHSTIMAGDADPAMVNKSKQVSTQQMQSTLKKYAPNANIIDANEPMIDIFTDLSEYMTADENGKTVLPTEIQVLPLGKWDTMKYGPIQITKDFCAAVVENFKKKIRKGLPIDINHDGEAAAGWMKDLYIKEGGDNPGLYAKSDWTPLGDEKLGGKIYRFFSPEWSEDYVDPETGVHHGPTLIAGTLTNRPLFKELVPLVASDGHPVQHGISMVLLHQNNFNKSSTPNMLQELTEVLAKTADELNDADKALLIAHESELDAAQKETFKNVFEAKDTAKTDDDDEDDMDAEDMTDKKKKGAEETVTIKASELDGIKAMAEEGRKAMEILNDKKADETAQGFLMSESNKEGRVLPKAKDALKMLILSFSETQLKKFSEVMEAVPTTKLFDEMGSSKANSSDGTVTPFEAKIQEIITASEGKLTFGQAMLEAAEKHPDMYKAYEEELKSTKK